MSEVVIMGNGPSGKSYEGIVDYACNLNGKIHIQPILINFVIIAT